MALLIKINDDKSVTFTKIEGNSITISEDEFMLLSWTIETLDEEMDNIQTEFESDTVTSTITLMELDFSIQYDQDSGFRFSLLKRNGDILFTFDILQIQYLEKHLSLYEIAQAREVVKDFLTDFCRRKLYTVCEGCRCSLQVESEHDCVKNTLKCVCLILDDI